jgi:hypothetical protein
MSRKHDRNDPATRRGTDFNRQLIERFPVTLSAADLLASGAAAEDSPPEPISFDPVPRRRNRKGGWTEQAQRDFHRLPSAERLGFRRRPRGREERQHRLPPARCRRRGELRFGLGQGL